MSSKFEAKRRELGRRLLHQPGALDPSIRRAAADGDVVPAAVASYAAKVRAHAYRVTDEDVEALKAAGYSEDQIFELTVSAAYGAALQRLEAGLGAMSAEAAGAEGERAG